MPTAPRLTTARPGDRPATSDEGPHRQLTQRSTPALWGELVARVFALDGVVEGHSQVSPKSSRAVFLADLEQEREPSTNLAPGRRLEPVHLHGVTDTSVHLVLPHERGEELVALGWAEPHQYEDFGTEYMVYGPRDAAEVDAVVSVVAESLAFARG
ncbi:luciferase family protein [Isoptericola nanjingensis]|uniref:luciferase domain-containing protein n=1 Tax=Isoptericola TaxID=254250 RepID=UPI0035F04B3E